MGGVFFEWPPLERRPWVKCSTLAASIKGSEIKLAAIRVGGVFSPIPAVRYSYFPIHWPVINKVFQVLFFPEIHYSFTQKLLGNARKCLCFSIANIDILSLSLSLSLYLSFSFSPFSSLFPQGKWRPLSSLE